MSFYEGIKLEKGMYTVGGKTFTNVLEELDPSENYKGTDMEGLDAYQRQLKRFDIKVSGYGCDKVEKFFSSSDSAVLFPEYISRAIRQGINSNDALTSVVAVKTDIDGIDYRPISSTTSAQADGSAVSEGNEIPSVNVRTRNDLVSLHKHGRVFSSTYEALRFQNLDILTIILNKIGEEIATEQFSDAVKVLINGDGSAADKAAEIKATYDSTPSTPALTYSHLLQVWESLGSYSLNTMVASAKTIKEILSLSEMKDANAGLNFQGTGNIVTPIGAKLIKSSDVGNYNVLGFDKNKTLQMVQSGNIVIDYDKVIDRQLDRASMSVTAGFARIFKDAVKILDYSVE